MPRKPYQSPIPPEDEFQPLAVLRLHWKKIFYISAGVILLIWSVAVIGDAVVSRAGRWVTQQAKYVEQRVTLNAEVTFIRDEILLQQETQGTMVSLIQAGERVGAGESYAVVCADGRDAEALSRLHALEQRLLWLKEADVSQNYLALNAEQLSFQVDQTFKEFVKNLDKGAYDRLAEYEEMFLHRSTTLEAALGRHVDLSKEIAEAEAQLADLETKYSPEHFMQCPAPDSGLYYPASDGLEQRLTPKTLFEEVTPEHFSRLRRNDSATDVNQNNVGKLIRGFTWYAVALLTTGEAQQLREGTQYAVLFPQESAREYQMKLEMIRRGGNQAIAIFSCDEKDDILHCLRTAKAELILDTVDGLTIPSEALRFLDAGEGQMRRKSTGAYIVRGGKTHWREVDVLYQGEQDAVVAWGTQNEAMAVEGDRITVSGSIQSVTRPSNNKLVVIGSDLLLIGENTQVIPAIPDGPTSIVTTQRRLFDETVISGKGIEVSQSEGKLILTGEDFSYREQRGAGLKIHDTVLVKGKIGVKD